MIKKSSFLKVKTILLLGVLFFAQITFAQVSKLAKLSEGKFIFYTPLSEEGWYSGNLYGYFFLYEKERTQRTEYTYEYVLLDKNLNKVYSGEFTEDFDKGANTAKYFSGTYENGKILFHINEYGRSTGGKFIDYEWYRVFDVKENKMSKAFGFDEKGGTYKSQEKDYSNPKVRYYYLRSVNEGFALHQSINWPYGVYYYSSLGNYESPAWFFKNSKENKQTKTL